MTKTKVAAAGAVLLLAAAYLGLPGWSAPLPPAPSGPTQQSLAAQQASLPVDAIADAEADAAVARQAVAPTPAAATTGALIAHVRYRDDRAPAVWSLLTLAPLQADTRYDSERQRTDDAGIARWQSLSPGSYRLGTLDGPGKLVDIAAGVTAEVAIELDPGMKIEGIVVDAAHAPVAGALVETEPMACVDALPEIAAVTGADGHFAARVQLPYVLVGARAAGFTAAPVQFLHGKQGNTAQVELVLGSGGGTVDGTVVDDAGRPIANATVIVGDGRVSGIGGHDHIPPFPAVTRSDAAGRFHAVGVPAGEQQLRARAPGFAPWTGTCEVAAGTSIESHIALDRGAVVRGTVTDSNARRLAGIEVVIGSWDDDLAFYRADSAADGTFELTGVPIGEVEVIAKDAEHGEARQRIKADASAPATCELRLSRGLELQGWVVDDAGQPVADAWLECYADIASGPWFTNVQSDARGHFVAINCPDTAGITIRVRGRGLEELEQRGVDPHTQDLRLRVRRTAPSTVRILGNVVGPDGRPVANADVRVRRLDAAGSGYSMATDNAGHFEFGPVPPGRWRLVVRIRDYPEFVGEARELGADATWDLGTIALARGGTARVHVLGEPAPHLSFLVSSDIGQRMSGVGDDGGTARTGALAAGDYHLLVDGDGIAATAVPFAIRAGEEVVVEVAPQPGVAQRFVCELPSGAQIDGVSLNVRRDDVVQAHVWADARPGQETAGQAWFAPGAYQLEAVAGELRGSATFTVGATAGPDVRVALH